MMAVSCFVRGDSVAADVRPKKLAAPMYFDFGWQIYNSVCPVSFSSDSSVVLRWIWLRLQMIHIKLAVEIRVYMFDIGQS
jgi:hypothetical protein